MQRPIVIAHRGASGYLPEHSLPAKALAFAQGADYLEQDVVTSRDGVPMVLHDPYLEAVTDVVERFPDRRRDDGHYYCVDFTCVEIQSLKLHERTSADGTPVYPGRFPPAPAVGHVPTLSEELDFIAALNRGVERRVGIYPEIKLPEWHAEHGIDATAAVLSVLDEHGFLAAGEPVFVQSFDADALRAAHEAFPELKLIQLLGGESAIGAADLESIAAYADGIGPPIARVLDSRLGDEAHAHGLDVHPYTLRRDALPAGVDDTSVLLERLFGEAGVDGIFTDFPDIVRHWIDSHDDSGCV